MQKFHLYFANSGVVEKANNLLYANPYEFNGDWQALGDKLRSTDLIMSHIRDGKNVEHSTNTYKTKDGPGLPIDFVESDLLFADIDGEKTIEEVKETLIEVSYFLYTSRNHLKDKKGKVAERFHVMFPLNKVVKDRDLYTEYLRKVIKLLGSDKTCTNFNRKFFGVIDNPNFVFYYHQTENDILSILPNGEYDYEPEVEFEGEELKEEIPRGEIHNTLKSGIWKLVSAGVLNKDDLLEQAMKLYSKSDNTNDEKQVRDIVDWCWNTYNSPNGKKYRRNDTDMAALFCELFGYALFRWSSEKETWYFWNGKFWEIDKTLQVDEYAKMIGPYIYRKAKEAKAKKWAIDCGNRSRINAIKELAKSKLVIKQSQLDCMKNLVNFENGTYDLDTLEFRQHDKGDYLTYMAPVKYAPDLKSPLWDDTLDYIYGEDEENREYIQKALSLCLSGYTTKLFHFLYGHIGSNGKTTILNTVKYVLGFEQNAENGYCLDTPIDSLVIKKNDSEAGVYQSRLKGARMIIASECNMNDKIHTTFLKSFTGGESITAREKYARYAVSYVPEGKLFISGNDKFKISDDGKAMWDRVRIVEYLRQIPEEKRKDNYWIELYEKEASGILNWLIDGWKKLKGENMRLNPTKEIERNIQDYREEEDIIQQFIDEQVEIMATNFVKTAMAHEFFIEYARKHSEYDMAKISKQAFGRKFRSKLLARNMLEDGGSDGKSRGIYGIRILSNKTQKAGENTDF